MNLTPHYITLFKIINRITFEKNRLWKFFPVRWFIKHRSSQFFKIMRKADLKKELTRILGCFEEFPSIYINDEDKSHIIKWANQTLAHQFDYLGSGLTKLDPIDWHVDFKSGFRWPRGRFYRNYLQVDTSNDADVKVPWELSRCHHLLWLGEAYLLTNEPKYAKEVVDQVENWIAENPLMYSINWTSAMDVSIRAVNWMYAANMIIESDYVDDTFSRKISRSLFEHAFYIYNNLEKGFPYSANHYASNITGLLFLGQFFRGTKYGKAWWHYALNEYFMEIRHQVLPSGVHFELSISYHRLMTELFSYPYLMLIRMGLDVPLDIQYRIQSMFEFVANYSKPNGHSPIIGDNDDGRLLPFFKYDFRDHRYLIGIANELYINDVFTKQALNGTVEGFFILNQTKKRNPTRQNDSNQTLASKVYSDGGFAIVRYEDFYLFFCNSGLSRYARLTNKNLGTHTHADLLSFELAIGPEDFIIDPGSYVYTSSMKYRNKFRSSSIHNTVVVDDINHHKLSEDDFFSVSSNAKPNPIIIKENQLEIELIGSYSLHSLEKEVMHHVREIVHIKRTDSCKIIDKMSLIGNHTVKMFYHFSPKFNLYIKDEIVRFEADGNFYGDLKFNCRKSHRLEVMEDEVSPSYGVIEKSQTLRLSADFESFFEIETKISWVKVRNA